MLRYTLCPTDPNSHVFSVTLTFTTNADSSLEFHLPRWISGSYLIRDFAAHIYGEAATVNGTHCPLIKKDLQTWLIDIGTVVAGAEIAIQYNVWAFDSSVRTAYLDQFRGFFNSGALLMTVRGYEQEPIELNVQAGLSSATQHWKVGTGLPASSSTPRYSFGVYTAPNYDCLIDCPVELGDFLTLTFSVYGTPHTVCITNAPNDIDSEQLVSDLKKICAEEIRFFEPKTRKSPVESYTFLLNATLDEYGGLEHRNSCALAAPIKCLPRMKKKATRKDYIRLLCLFSHEYFHTWFVKRIQPKEFIGIDFSKEVPSRLLWLFEGFTSYYEALLLVRCGLVSPEEYMNLLSLQLRSVLGTKAHLVQTLEESSFDAWIKYYKPTANRANTLVSYYQQGALAALVLDSAIREIRKGTSLDDFMRTLWLDYCKNTPYQGISRTDILQHINRLTGKDLSKLLHSLVSTTQTPDYAHALSLFGIELKPSSFPPERRLLGIAGNLSEDGFFVTQVFAGETGESLGLAPGDKLKINNSKQSFSTWLLNKKAGDALCFRVRRKNRSFFVHGFVKDFSPCLARARITHLTDAGKSWLSASVRN